jgi:hypothetical protein
MNLTSYFDVSSQALLSWKPGIYFCGREKKKKNKKEKKKRERDDGSVALQLLQ